MQSCKTSDDRIIDAIMQLPDSFDAVIFTAVGSGMLKCAVPFIVEVDDSTVQAITGKPVLDYWMPLLKPYFDKKDISIIADPRLQSGYDYTDLYLIAFDDEDEKTATKHIFAGRRKPKLSYEVTGKFHVDKSSCTVPMKKAVLELLPSVSGIYGIKDVIGFEEFDDKDLFFFAVDIDMDAVGKEVEREATMKWYKHIKIVLFQKYCVSVMFDERCASGFDFNPKTNWESFVLYLVAFRNGNQHVARETMQSLKRQKNIKCDKERMV